MLCQLAMAALIYEQRSGMMIRLLVVVVAVAVE